MKHRKRQITARLILAAVFATSCHALEEETLYGLWWTPGGNIVDIRPDHHGKLVGTLVHVLPGNQAIGFARGQLALTSFQFNDSSHDIKFEVSTRPIDTAENSPAEIACRSPDWIAFEGKLTTPDRISGEAVAPEFSLTATDTCTMVSEDRFTLPPYRRFQFSEIARLPDRQIFEATVIGNPYQKLTASVDYPQGLPHSRGFPTIRVSTVNDEPVPYAEVVWQVTSTVGNSGIAPRHYRTETNAEGEAALRFTLLPNGRFAPINQMRQENVPATLPQGEWLISATVPELGINQAVNFTQLLDGPDALISFMSGNRPASELVIPIENIGEDQAVALQVTDLTHSGLSEITVKLVAHEMHYPKTKTDPLPYPDAHPYDETLCVIPRNPSRPGIYDSNPDLTITFGPTPRNCHLKLPRRAEGIRVMAKIDQPTLNVQYLNVYLSSTQANESKLRSYLKTAYENLDYFRQPARQAPSDQLQLIRQKLGYIDRAFALLNDPKGNDGKINNRVQFFAANAYAELLRESAYQHESDMTASLYNGLGRDSPERVRVPVRNAHEQQQLVRASIRAVQSINWEAGRNVLLSRIPTIDQLSATMDQIVAMPFEMAWIIVSGETWDGTNQDAVDRLLLGLDIASFRVATPRWLNDAWEMVQRRKHTRRARQRIKEARNAGLDDMHMHDAYDNDRFRRRMREQQHNMTADEAAQMDDRLNALLIQAAWENKDIPSDLRQRLRYTMNRVANSRSGRNLARALDELEEIIHRTPELANSARGRLAVRIGAMEHWLKAMNEAAHWRSLVKQRKARMLRKDQHFVSADGKTEVFVEYQITPRRRVDYAIAQHFDDRIEIHVVDLTGQLQSLGITVKKSKRRQHREKTALYGELFEKAMHERFPDKTILVKATELYWRESNVEARLSQLTRTMGLLR